MIARKEPMPGCFGRRTPEWLRQKAIASGLRVGRKVRVERYEKDAEGKTMLRRWKSGRVTGIYRYIFACEIGGRKECFRYNQLLGEEKERVKLGG